MESNKINKKKIRKFITCIVLVLAIAVASVPVAIPVQAADQPYISAKQITLACNSTWCVVRLENVGTKSKQIKWSCGNEDIVSVEYSGALVWLQGVNPGKTTITAKLGSKTYKCEVLVEQSTLRLAQKSYTIMDGSSELIRLLGEDQYLRGEEVKWTTSNKKVARIITRYDAAANVMGIKPGTATITAKIGSKKFECTVTVKRSPLKMEKSMTIKVGSRPELSLDGTIPYSLHGKVKWTSSNKKVVRIDSSSDYSASITGLKRGTATITAKVGSKKYKCKITVRSNIKKPGRVTLSSVKSTKATLRFENTPEGKIIVKWKKTSGAFGYQIQCSKSRKFNANYHEWVSAARTSVSFMGDSGKKYYVRVRAYQDDSNKGYVFGPWSNVKSVTVKYN